MASKWTSRPVLKYLAVADVAILAFVFPAVGPGRAATTPAPLLLVKSNDLATLNLCAQQGSTICAQQATQGVTLPPFTWTGCGGLSDPLACQPGQVPIETAEHPIWVLAQHHYAGPVIYDIEVWSFTPAKERADPLTWICRAARLVKTDPKLQVILTPYSGSPGSFAVLTHAQQVTMIAEDAKAAQCGAYAVGIQSQFANGHPVTVFQPFIQADVKAIRKESRKVTILAGLSTNNPVPQTVANLTADWVIALSAGVQGFWLNANDWLAKNRCTAAQGGPGCPETGIRLLEAVDLATP
jgi:hypothetical protein